jgi:actin-related protein 5
MAKYRDRKLGKTFAFAGSDVYADTTARGHMRAAFEAGSGVVCNWDVMEYVLDYLFLKLGIDGQNGAIDTPIVMTEALANLPYSRKSMSEILFECYGAPSVAYGVDALFSYAHNGGKSGLVVSSSHSSTHLIPVIDSRALPAQATRLNWGGSQSAEYLLKLIRLKYPGFTGKLNSSQAEHMVRDHCFVAQDYVQEVGKVLDWTGLEDRDVVIQYPFTEEVIIQKSEEELARAAEKRKESGRRLQEQAAKMRLEKLVRKEQELDYYRALQTRLATENKKESKRLLDAEDLKDENALAKTIKELDVSIRKSRQKDLGGGAEIEDDAEPPNYDLLDIPDEDLDEAGIKQKRHQRLMKSNHEARARAKAEKAAEAARVAEIARLDEERRLGDLEGWLEERRAARAALVKKLKERERLKADLGNRKSLASQIRMKSIAALASDTPAKKRRRGGDDDTFGADDDDWGIYRQVANDGDNSDDEEEDLGASLKALEQELLEHDPDFTELHTHDAQSDWSTSLIHAFLRGPRAFDGGSARETHQLHLNVERLRVPEVVFQPSIAGLDQAGIVEIAADILMQRLSSQPGGGDLRDIFLTGGATLFQGFEERLAKELRAVLPVERQFGVRSAKDPVGDAWRGAGGWVGKNGGEEWKKGRVTRGEWLEKGGDYIKVRLRFALLHSFSSFLFLDGWLTGGDRNTIWGMLIPIQLFEAGQMGCKTLWKAGWIGGWMVV